MVIFCLGLTAVLIVIAFGFVRSSRSDLTASDMSTRIHLAQGAARMGLEHAMEQIARDLATSTLDLADGTGGSSIPVAAPPTFLDGMYRAPFVSMTRPNEIVRVDQNLAVLSGAPSDPDDVRVENLVVGPLLNQELNGEMRGLFDWFHPFSDLRNKGPFEYDGRGRFIEPDFHNTARPHPTTADATLLVPVPVATTWFSNQAATLPQRSQGLFLDSSFRRLTTGTILEQRLAARYRLRYAVGVEDLSGHLLTNPTGCNAPREVMQSNDARLAPEQKAWPMDAVWDGPGGFVGNWRNPLAPYRIPSDPPAADYRPTFAPGQPIPMPTGSGATSTSRPGAWIAAASNAWYNMAKHIGGRPLSALSSEHVFQGRGNGVTADRSPSDGFPTTFPTMLRNRIETTVTPHSGIAKEWWGFWSRAQNASTNDDTEPDGLYRGATQAGGNYLSLGGNNDWQAVMLGGYAPRLSWIDQYYSIRGNLSNVSWQDTAHNALEYCSNTFTTTPYGQRLVASTKQPSDWRWYEGRVDSPWYINLLTAAPQTVDLMIAAYMPRGTNFWILQNETYRTYDIGSNPPTYTDAAGSYPIIPNIRIGLNHRDLFTRLSGPAFQHYQPPQSAGLVPDFQKTEDRPAAARYPGSLWWDGLDAMGKNIDVNSTTRNSIGMCSKNSQAFYTYPTANFRGTFFGGGQRNPGPFPLANGYGTSPEDLWIWHAQPPAANTWNGLGEFRSLETYYADLIMAFTQSIAIARAAWTQYPCRAFAPSTTTISSNLRHPKAFDSLEEIDRLFLRQLGENFDTPGDGTPQFAVALHHSNTFAQSYLDDNSYKPSNTIATMAAKWQSGFADIPATTDVDESVTAVPDGPKRANVMERVLNDWRMSFLGAGPQYSETFRPLDFSGDGEVHCSAYQRNPTATADDEDKGVAWWKPVVSAGQGPTPDHWFSLTGCLFIGKSHYYRILTRGELFDNLVQKPVADATLESVLAADPEGVDANDLRVLFQRWHFNRYTGELPRQVE